MLIYVRHGETNLNGKSGASEERLRGWLPVDLTSNGIKQAEKAGGDLKGIDPTSFHTSDLPRTIHTSNIIGKTIGMKATPTFSLRDWNTGDLAGKKFDDVKDQLFHYIDHPDESTPNGEPLNTYLERFVPFIKSLVESPDTHLAVGHARGSQVISGLAQSNGEWIHPGPLKDKPIINPGQFMIISPDWTTIPSK